MDWPRRSSRSVTALGFWAAHPGATAALPEIYNAEDREHALKAVKAFGADYGSKWPKAVTKITEFAP